jgi:hypothetical protein
MPDLIVGVQGQVAIIAHNGNEGHRDGTSTAWIAISVAERTDLVQVLLAEGEVGLSVKDAQCRLGKAGVSCGTGAVGVPQECVADMSPGQGPVVLWVAFNPLDAAWQVRICASLQLVLVDVGLGTASLYHPDMWEVISEAQEHHVDGDMKVGGTKSHGGRRRLSR